MALAPGTRLGSYEIVGALGAGGMGEVYRAKDTRLKRDVALKILPESFAADPERIARMHREAQVLAALNHPNIAAIHGFEDSGATHALVLEFVDGETLADRIARGPISLEEALPIAKQIAEALEAAHEQGIIHRDLKPANIKLRPDGAVKVLDFGLAKLAEPSAVATSNPSPLSLSPTITSPALMTGVGVLLGTAAYMSPEQAKGRPADKRSDIWAFGCVFYEMMTGKRAFEGGEVAEVLAAVIRAEPDWTELSATVPPALRRLLRRCLRKDPEQRLHDIADVRLEIEDIEHSPDESFVARVKSRHVRSGVLLAGAAITLIIASTAADRIRGSNAPTPVRFMLGAPPQGTIDPGAAPSPAMSPDGRYIAFVARRGGASVPTLWVRAMDSLVVTEVPATEGASLPFWSPDSRLLGFAAQNRLQAVQPLGGRPQPICNLPVGADFGGGTWNNDGVIVFAAGRNAPLMRVAASGGVPVAVDVGGEGPTATRRHPQFLPDGRHFLYFAQSRISVASLDGGPSKPLVDSDSKASYAAPGYLLYVVQRSLVAHQFNAASLELEGKPFDLASDIATDIANGRSAFSVSNVGALVYRAEEADDQPALVWFDRTGKSLGALGTRGPVSQFSLSPDEQRLAIARRVPGPLDDIWVMEIASGALSRITFDQSAKTDPIWTPDGQSITFNRVRNGQTDIFQVVVGSTTEQLVSDAPGSKGPDDWSHDGKFLLYQSRPSVFALPANGTGKPIKLGDVPGYVDEPHFAPDGRWVAYSSDESGRTEIYVARFPTFDGKRQISVDGGTQPRWNGDGKELFFLSPDRKLMVAQIQESSQLIPGRPTELFQTTVPSPTQDQYAVSRDGRRFLVLTGTARAEDSAMTIVLNWQAGQR